MISITNFSAVELKPKGETNNGLSLTIPDQAISASELLRKYATGQPLGFKSVTPVYDDGDTIVPEFYKLDNMDRLHFMQQNSDRIQELKHDYEQYRKTEIQKADDHLLKTKETEEQAQKQAIQSEAIQSAK